MKIRVLLLLCTLSLFAVSGFAQTSNSLPFSAVTPPAAPVLTTLGNLSPTGKIYTGQVMPINGTGFTSSCVVNVDGAAQPASTFAFSSATLINYTVPASLGSTAGTSHTITTSCPLTPLTLNSPVTLPNAKVGVSYSASLSSILKPTGGITPYTYALASGSLPTGLVLSPSGTVTGTPSGVGCFTCNFNVLVKDSSLITTSHSATLSWVASVSPVVGYNAYRSSTSGGPTKSSMATF